MSTDPIALYSERVRQLLNSQATYTSQQPAPPPVKAKTVRPVSKLTPPLAQDAAGLQQLANNIATIAAMKEKENQVTSVTPNADAVHDLADAIAKLAKGNLDEARVRVIAKEEAAKVGRAPQAMVLNTTPIPNQPVVTVGLVHYLTPVLNFWVNGRYNVYMYGPAGSSKSTAAEQLAKARGWDYDQFSMQQTASKSDILGFTDAMGRVTHPGFRRIFENGGVFFFDEYDNPSTLHVALNTALANRRCSFPDGLIEMHPDCVIVAAGNTAMGGGNSIYNGRQSVDGASVDRWIFLNWEYDWELVAAYAGSDSVAKNKRTAKDVQVAPPNDATAQTWRTQWTQWVHDAVQYVDKNKSAIKVLVTPRAVTAGIYALLNSNLPIADIADSTVFRWRDEAGKANILQNVPLPVLAGR